MINRKLHTHTRSCTLCHGPWGVVKHICYMVKWKPSRP